MIKKAFRLPKMNISEYDNENMEDILDEIKRSDTALTVYKTGTEYKLLFTDLGENEFGLLLVLLDRHIEFFDFMKLAIITTEKMRAGDENVLDIQVKALEFLRRKRRRQFDAE